MTETQKILLQLVKELDEICRNNDITYYFIGGSALGAVRHNGFIPWDDDADIVMDYWNYQKFVKVMSSIKLPENRKYYDSFLAPYKLTTIFGRYAATDTTQIFDFIAFQEDNSGIKVDVFMLIPCPDPGPARERFFRKYHIWAEMGHSMARSQEANPEDYWKFAKKVQKKGMHPLRKKCFDALKCEKYSASKQYLYCYEKLIILYDKTIFGEPVYFKFEDMMAPVPTKYQEHFRVLFGDDWEYIPDFEGQISHENFTTLLLDVGYEDITKDYMRYKRDDDFAIRQKYKYMTMRYWQARRNLRNTVISNKIKLIEKKYELFWAREKERILELFEQKDYLFVLDLTKDYISEQTSIIFKDLNVAIRIPDKMLEVIAVSAMNCNKLKIARRILGYYSPDDSSKIVCQLKILLNDWDILLSDLELNGFNNENMKALENMFLEYPNVFAFNFWYIKSLLKRYNDGNEKSLYGTIIKLCDKYPDYGEMIKLKADLLMSCGDRDSARVLYEEAINRTNNGIILKEIESIPDFDIVRPEVLYRG